MEAKHALLVFTWGQQGPTAARSWYGSRGLANSRTGLSSQGPEGPRLNLRELASYSNRDVPLQSQEEERKLSRDPFGKPCLAERTTPRGIGAEPSRAVFFSGAITATRVLFNVKSMHLILMFNVLLDMFAREVHSPFQSKAQEGNSSPGLSFLRLSRPALRGSSSNPLSTIPIVRGRSGIIETTVTQEASQQASSKHQDASNTLSISDTEQPDLSISTSCISSTLTSSEIESIEPQPSTSRQAYLGDRHIPMRRGYSFEAAYYLLTKDTTFSQNNTALRTDIISVQLDIREQIEQLEHMHQRRAMHKSMVKVFVGPEFRQNKILQLINSTKSYDSENSLDSNSEEKTWKCKPRQKKLIGSPDMYTIPDSLFLQDYSDSIGNMVDWSNLNIFVVGCKNKLRLLPKNMPDYYKGIYIPTSLKENDHIIAIKCSNSGSQIAVASKKGKIIVMDIILKKCIWRSSCMCYSLHPDTPCIMCGICWSKRDKEILM
ncbi:hypothetical protein DMN91_011090 [Ooceraea biroi]|uniref:Uncharacterized protein n=1 Tax=Ooceraea biroi TaxID=2015173 RepID=A0A3L8D9N3_OOCBI|nr:hypothetical protein DMN91_011090 [Ooceraea biroi]